ncbi:MAG: flagellar hook capping FlgD N-terminal domain-containing protein [Acidovorax sp.]|uniref:flagellar hook assembly protein FlgD n=1 Tax=Acidovorax sp. TaxID=1872122 RepID=UPI0039E489AF
MLITPIDTSALDAGATSTSSSTTTSTDPADMQDRFLTLLVAQLNNQDPMNPLDNAEMTTQMAQISTVTGIQQLNQTMTSLADQFSMLQVMQGASMVGRTVLTEGNQLSVADGVGSGSFELASTASNVTVQVVTAGGTVVDTLDLGTQAAGRHSFAWDASSYAGDTSTLLFQVTATNGTSTVTATPLTQSTVLTAGSTDGSITLELDNGSTVSYSQIRAVL